MYSYGIRYIHLTKLWSIKSIKKMSWIFPETPAAIR